MRSSRKQCLAAIETLFSKLNPIAAKSVCPPIAQTILVLLLALCAVGRAQDTIPVVTVPRSAIECFESARCGFVSMESVKLLPNNQGKLFPNSIRTGFPSKAFTTEDGTIPFQVYRSDTYDGNLTLHSTGVCRNISTLVPIPSPGFYWVRYYHPKASLIEIEVDTTDAILRFAAICELHE